MDYLSICAIVKDENAYLPEWIEYHKLVGVERFYIYDNGSRVPLAQTLARDVAEGRAVVIPFPGRARQCEAYMNCALHAGMKTTWLAFIDVDEFICPKETDDLRILFRTFEGFGGVGLNWQMFGPSGLKERPPGLQIEHFTMKGPVQFEWNTHIKTVAKPPLMTGYPNCHFASYRPGTLCVNEKGMPFSGAFSRPVHVDRVQLNHYTTRSLGEFQDKIKRMCADGTGKDMTFFHKVEKECSSIRDESILRFVPRLREAMLKRA